MHEWCSVSGPNANWDIQHLGGDMSYDKLNVNHYDHNWSEANGGDGSYRNYIREGLHFNRQVIYNTNYGVMVWTNASSGTEIDTDQFGRVTTNSIGRPTIGDEHCKVSDPWNPVPWSAVLVSGDLFTVTHTETYKRTADTVWHVQTGGMAIPGRKNLWQFNGSAWEIADKRAVPPFYLPNLNEVTDKTQIVLKELGALKADGTLWLTLPDCVDKDITPTLAGKDFYTFSVGGQKYKLRIVVNSINPLSPDHVPRYNNYCVGQLLSFAPTWSPSLPLGTQRDPIKWTFGGTFVNTFTNADDDGFDDDEDDFPASSRNYFEDTSLLNSETTYAWWVSGGFNPSATYTAIVGEGLTFSNGQYLAVAANGKFNMFRPQILGHGFIYPGVINLVTYNLPQVGLGMVGGSQTISWRTQVGLDTNFPAMIFHAQMVNGGYYWDVPYPAGIPYTCLDRTDTTGGGTWLDNSFPYEDDGGTPVNTGPSSITTNAAISFLDGPSLKANFCSFGQLTFDFNNYLCFQPTSAGSIPVALERVEWLMNGRTDLVNTNWTLTSTNMAGPYFNNDNSFPQWSNIFQNSGNE